MELPVSVKLSSLFCHDEADGIGNAEPYLWTIYFKIDGETITQSQFSLVGDAVFHFGAGSHENLRTHAVLDGESVKIPAEVGEWSTTLRPIVITDLSNKQHFIPGTLGVAAILMEEDNVSHSGAEAGHKALNQFVQNTINDFIHNLRLIDFADPNTSQEVLDEKIKLLIQKIKDESAGKIKTAITNQQPWYNDAWAFVNKDDNIGSEVFMFNKNDIVQSHYSVSLNKRWKNEGDWEIFGLVTAPNPCLSFLVAVNKQKNEIKGIEDQIRATRAEMVRAPVTLRNQLQKEIDELVASLAPLERELERLGNLLNRCYLRQSTTGRLGSVIDGRFDDFL